MTAGPTKRKRKPPVPGRVVASTKLMSNRKPHFYVVHLWDDRKRMVRTLDLPDKNTQAVTFSYWNLPSEENPQPHPDECLGEIHFAMGAWSPEVIAHEVFHAVLHRGRMVAPFLGWMLHVAQDFEEHLAYELGEWTQALLGWLNEKDPAPAETMNRKVREIIVALTAEELAGIAENERQLSLDFEHDDERASRKRRAYVRAQSVTSDDLTNTLAR